MIAERLSCPLQASRTWRSGARGRRSRRNPGAMHAAYGRPWRGDSSMRLLLVEDEPEMAAALSAVLLRYDMVVDHARTKMIAEEAILSHAHDAVLLTGGSEKPFDFFAKASGRELDGIHFAMDFLPQQNRRVSGETIAKGTKEISAKDKHVIVIGGGDTGSDCIGTSFRQGAKSVTQLEIMPQPPKMENKALSWPHWPLKLRISSSQAEGAAVEYSISTTGFSGEGGKIKKLHYTRVDSKLQPVPGSEGALDADLVLLAMGFSGPTEDDVVKEMDLPVVARGRFKGLEANERDYRIRGRDKLFVAGDMRRGQSLVVWAIREGRQAAASIDRVLMGRTDLPR
ncbi:MAG: FAD-dependent oxidoreductase [Hyphomicrobium sp.]|nr:FAD-dependent oxidoreductase [Hyphomicrobium sp.]